MIPDWLSHVIVDHIFNYIEQSGIVEKGGFVENLRGKLGLVPEKEAFKRALDNAFAQFQQQHPEWAASFFDKSFLQKEGASILELLMLRHGQPSAHHLAERWAEALNIREPARREARIRELIPVAQDLLDDLNNALKAEEDLRELYDSKAFEHIAGSVDTIARAILLSLDSDKATSDTHRAYLHWLIERNLYLDQRGTYQAQRQAQVKLEKVYISLRAQREETSNIVDQDSVEQELAELEAKSESDAHTEQVKDQSEQGSPRFKGDLLMKSSQTGEILELSTAVSRYDHLVILGDPGSGKTTLLRFLALKHAYALWENRTEASSVLGPVRFPVQVRIADYAQYGLPKGQSLSEFLADYCGMHECPKRGLADLLASELHGGNCLILLDGMDEVVGADDRQKVMHQIEDFVRHHSAVPNRFVVTSRIAGYQNIRLSGGFTHCTVQEMDEVQIRQFLEAWCPAVEAAQTPDLSEEARGQSARREIEEIIKAVQTNPGVGRLASNPLLLRTVALIHRTGALIPQKRITLYKLASDILARTHRIAQGVPESALVDESYLTSLLSKLAYWLHLNKPTGLATEREVYRVLGEGWADIKRLSSWEADDPDIEQAIRKFLQVVREHTGLIVERAPHSYGFMHLTFEEYYAARSLVARSRTREQLIRKHLHDPRWEEPILLALAFVGLDSPEDAADLLEISVLAKGEEAQKFGFEPSKYEELLGRDYLFALRCLGDQIPTRTEVMKQLVGQLTDELLYENGAARFERYRQALEERLGYLKGSKSASLLSRRFIEAAKDENFQVRSRAAQNLGLLRQTSNDVLATLVRLLSDDESYVRASAAQALGFLGEASDELVNLLLRCLSTDSHDVRRYAAQSLGRLEQISPQVISVLLHSIIDDTHTIYFYAAQMQRILQQPTDEVIFTLTEALKEEDYPARDNALIILEHLDQPSAKTSAALIQTFSDSDLPHIRSKVLEILGKLKPPPSEVIGILLHALHDADSTVSSKAAQVLGRLGLSSDDVVTALIGILKRSTDFSVRDHAAISLGQLGQESTEVVNTLLIALNDNDTDVRYWIIRSLEQLKQPSLDVVTALLHALSDEDRRNRASVATILGRLSQPSNDVLTNLVHALTDSDPYVRYRAAESLGSLGQASADVTIALRQRLNDPDDRVRTGAANALAKLGQATADVAIVLRQRLNDPDDRIRTGAANALAKLEQASDDEMSVLLDGLKDNTSKSNRRRSAYLLGQIGRCDMQTIQALSNGLRDWNRGVREACVKVLVQLGKRFPAYQTVIEDKFLLAIRDSHLNENDNFGHSVQEHAYNGLWLLVVGGEIDS